MSSPCLSVLVLSALLIVTKFNTVVHTAVRGYQCMGPDSRSTSPAWLQAGHGTTTTVQRAVLYVTDTALGNSSVLFQEPYSFQSR